MLLPKEIWEVSCFVSRVRSRCFSGLLFPTFGLTAEIYSFNLRIQFECGEIWTRKTPNKGSLYAVFILFVFIWNTCYKEALLRFYGSVMNTLKKVFAVTLKKYLIFRASLFWRYHLTKLKSPESPVMRKVLNQHFFNLTGKLPKRITNI